MTVLLRALAHLREQVLELEAAPLSVSEPELGQVVAVMLEKVIEALLPPALQLPRLLSPMAASGFALHGLGLVPPDQDLQPLLVPALRLPLVTVFPVLPQSPVQGEVR